MRKNRVISTLLLFTILLSSMSVSVANANEVTKSSVITSKEPELGKISDLEVPDNRTPKAASGRDMESFDSETETSETTESSNGKTETTESSEIEEKDAEVKEDRIQPQALGEALVDSWADFVTAIRDETATKIILTGSFENPSNTDAQLSSYVRKNDLEIDGQGYRVNVKNSSIQLGNPSNALGSFHMHDIVLNQVYGGAVSEDIVGTRLNYPNGGKWTYRFGNITTEPGVQRLARASHSEVTIYGEMNLDTRAENFYLGSLIMEDGTTYKGNVNFYDFSVFWYNVPASSTSTGASREFTIGKNCRVDVGQTQIFGRTYPAVYHHYQALTVGENSVFNVDMPGNAVRFDDAGAGMTIKKDAIVNLTSKQTAGSIVAFSNNNTYLNAETGSFFYVIGTSNQPLINLSANAWGTGNDTRTGNSFVLDSPAQYDLRNLNDTKTAVNLANSNRADNTFTILDSDIDLWNVGVPVLGPSSEVYAKVPSFQVEGSGTKEVVATSVTGLDQFKQAKYRRISGMNQEPEIEWLPITDADKTLRGRVVIGQVPDNNGLVGGEIIYIPVYASKNQAKVTLTDTYGNVRTDLMTDENGYIDYTDISNPVQFQKAEEIVSGIAERGPWIASAPFETTVIDVTPPEPAKVDHADGIQSITTKLTGTGEPNSIITLTLNGTPTTIPAVVVGADGKWEIDISSLNLVMGDVIQFFLQDQSGLITELEPAERPSTNDTTGNINPAADMNYRDATFKEGTKITVVGVLSLVTIPDGLEFGDKLVSNKTENYRPAVNGDLVVSDTRGGAKKPWRLTLSQSEVLKNGSISLEDALYYKSQLGEMQITTVSQIVESDTFASDGSKDISATWLGDEGFKLTVPVEKQRVGDYSGKLLWKLEDVPGN